jgi:Peptidase family M28
MVHRLSTLTGGNVAATRTPPARWSVILLLVLAVVVGALALLPLRSPAPIARDAPPTVFSAERARVHLDRIATRPRPTSSDANSDVRQYLVGQLDELGLRPTVQDVTASTRTPGYAAVAGRAHNIHATLPGTAGGERVLIVAHYDSVVLGPGATDDGIGVATILELARVLRSEPATPRHTVEFLLTDGEELGHIGAQGFLATAAAGDPETTVVLNLEARGTEGRLVMFETGEHNGALLPALTDHTPFATSISDEIYGLLPNDTDFTVLKAAGFTGMNFAVVGGSADYDTELDDLAHQRLETLQDMGSTVLAATRRLSGEDVALTAAGNDVYFTTFGIMVRYPEGAALVLAGIAAGLAALTVLLGRRAVISTRGVAVVALTFPLPLLAAAAVGWAGWEALVALRPQYASFLSGDPYRPGPATLGLVALTAVACLGWLLLVRRCGALTVAAGILCWFAGLALLSALLVPGASYLFCWPALVGAVALAVATQLSDGSQHRAVIASVAILPCLALFLPLAAILFPTVGLALAGAPLVVIALMLVPVLPALLDPLRQPRAVPVLLGAGALIGFTLVGVGAAADGVDPVHPAQVSLLYVRDADTGRSTWLSDATAGQSWLVEHVPEPPMAVDNWVPALAVGGGYRQGAAETSNIPLPEAEIVGTSRTGDVREVRLRLRTDRPSTTALSFYADGSGGTQLVDATVEGQVLPGGSNRSTTTRWTWGCHFVAPGDGVDMVLRMRGDAPLPLRLLAFSAEVPADALWSPRPAGISWTAGGYGQSIGLRTVEV